jgi:hypothetical protein
VRKEGIDVVVDEIQTAMEKENLKGGTWNDTRMRKVFKFEKTNKKKRYSSKASS